MREANCRCVRCGGLSDEAGSVLRALAGPMAIRRRPDPIELCGTCSRALAAWLDGPPSLPTLDPTTPPLMVPA